MQDKKNNKEVPDAFSDLVRQKLEDYRLPVDADCWEGIAQHITPPASKRRNLWWVGSVAASVAVILLALLFRPADKTPLNMVSSGPMTNTIPGKSITGVQQDKAIHSPTPPNNLIVPSPRPRINRYAVAQRNTGNDTQKQPEEDIVDIIKSTISSIDTIHLADNTEIPFMDDKDEPARDSVPSINNDEKKLPGKTTYTAPRLLVEKKKRKTDNWLMAANISSGSTFSDGSTTSGINRMYGENLKSSSSSVPESSNDMATPSYNYAVNKLYSEEFSDLDHGIPISFGLTVRKDFSNHIGIETGVTYTYLSTKMKRTGESYYRARQEVHYLGIPVNFVVYVWNNQSWNLYFSGGGMLEKGLQGIYSQHMYENDKLVSTVREKGSVSGVQWSLNASIGASYILYDNWGLYMEPRFSYYFGNDQPISIRTDKKNVFGIAGGIRYKF